MFNKVRLKEAVAEYKKCMSVLILLNGGRISFLKGMEMAQLSTISMRMPSARTFGCAILINITYIN